ncbi:hypothetical protein GEMRC1_006147 [Eukaryota sp. GEM-RC1]
MDMCSHNRNITANDIVAAMKTLYAVDTSTACAYRARNRLLASTYGSPEDSYIDLPAYLDELEERNPGSEINLEDDDGVFQRCFIGLKPRFEALRHCRKVISVDGTHLFSKHRRILLTATTLDADGHVYPLCYLVVSVENTSNWKYFFTHLKSGWSVLKCHSMKLYSCQTDKRGCCPVSVRYLATTNLMDIVSAIWWLQ